MYVSFSFINILLGMPEFVT